jgi:predicted TPR repeat methyltransferase
MVTAAERVTSYSSHGTGRPRIALPDRTTVLPQDAEWCVVEIDGEWREVRFHDYAEIYEQPGLYERLFYDVLACDSPAFTCARLMAAMRAAGADPGRLRVLDLGAGNGIVGETLVRDGVELVVGVDILPEARAAAERDRPGVYADYLVADMSRLTAAERDRLAGHRLNALTCVAALGFGDIPPESFRSAYNLLPDGAWVAFTIKEDFLSDADTSGFAGMIRDAVKDELLRVADMRGFEHRRATNGQPLRYMAVIGNKAADIPPPG